MIIVKEKMDIAIIVVLFFGYLVLARLKYFISYNFIRNYVFFAFHLLLVFCI